LYDDNNDGNDDDNHNSDDDNNLVPAAASNVFSRCAEMIKLLADELDLPDDEITIRECRALYKLGFALTEIGYYDDAVENFENAQQLNPRSRSLKASILYSAGWALLANNEPGKAKKKINASRKIMDQGSDLHELYKEMLLVYAEALVATCDYREASSFYEVIVENLRSDKDDSPIEFGTALYRKGRLDYVMGNLDSAKKTLDECIQWKIEIMETSDNLACAHALLGDIYLQQEKSIEAKKCYEASIQIRKQLNCDMQKLEYQVTTAKLLFLRNEFDSSRQLLDDIVKQIQENPVMVLDQSAYDLRMISRIYCSSGDTVTSITILEECLTLTQNRPFSLERSWIYMELGHCLIEESKVKEGLTCYEDALGIQITKLGESPQIIETSKLIGNVHYSLGDYEASLSIFLKVHEILLRVSPDNIDKIAEILFLIGDTYESQVSYQEAGETYENCLEVLLDDRAPEHADIGKVHHRIGEAALKRNDLDVALTHFVDALRIRKMNFDERVVAETLQSLGIVYRKRKDYSSAKKCLLESLEIRKNLRMGNESCETVLELAHVYRLQGDYSNASKLLSKGLELVDETDVHSSHINITFGHLKLSQGDFVASEGYYQVALDIRQEMYGQDHRFTGNAHRSLGIVCYVQDKKDEAYKNLTEYIRICDLYGEECWETIDFVLCTLMMGDLCFSDDKRDEATVHWTYAKELFDETEFLQVTLPDLESLINRRLGDDGSINRDDEISFSKEEIDIIRKIHFIDD
jgi:tetratricopeptide (TPR) repeat protein